MGVLLFRPKRGEFSETKVNLRCYLTLKPTPIS
jgi:hypothetical protein